MSNYSFFKFQIKNEKYQVYKKFGAFVLLLNAIAFFYLSSADVSPFTHLLFLALAIMLGVYGVYSFLTKSIDKSYIVLFVISALAWVTELRFITPALILIGLMVMQILAQYKIALTVDKEGVIFTNYREKRIVWNNVEHLILKDGLLTIDLEKDKIIQLYPDFSLPVIVQRGGSLNSIKWMVTEDYPELELAVNHFYQEFKNHQ